jgi:hypothetical protein
LDNLIHIVLLAEEQLRVVTVGKNIEKFFHGEEVESWEDSSLRGDEIVESLLALSEICVNFLQLGEDLIIFVILCAELDDCIAVLGVLKKSSNFLVNLFEIATVCWKFDLHFFRVKEQVNEE